MDTLRKASDILIYVQIISRISSVTIKICFSDSQFYCKNISLALVTRNTKGSIYFVDLHVL